MTDNKLTAIVTGASGGLGTAIATTFVSNGFNVILTGTNEGRLKEAHAKLAAPDASTIVVANVASELDRIHLVAETVKRFGRIDVLVNNAGIFEPRPFLDVDEAHLDRFLEINLKGTFFLTQAVIPHLQKAGGGAIINIGTVLVDHAVAGVPTTAPIASKGAIHALTGQLAAEFGKDNIRVNTIAPGIIRTPIHARNGIDDVDSLAGLHLLERVGEPGEIARAALLLATSDFVTGTTLNVDGGHVAGHALQ